MHVYSHQEHGKESNLFQDDWKKDQVKIPLKVLRLRAAALEMPGHRRSRNQQHQRRIGSKALAEDLEADLFQEIAEVQERTFLEMGNTEFLQENTELRGPQERALLENTNPEFLFQDNTEVRVKTLLEKDNPEFLFQDNTEVRVKTLVEKDNPEFLFQDNTEVRVKTLLEKDNPEFLFQENTEVRVKTLLEKGNPQLLFQENTGLQERTLLENANPEFLQEITVVKGLQERTLLEKNDPEFEPVTPMCSLNPPTVSEGGIEVPPFPIGFSPLSESAVKGVEKFVYFIGYGRSGHSTIASMLDAHPNIIIAHEYSIFENLRTTGATNREFLFNELYWNSYENAVCRGGWRNAGMDAKEDMPGLWQGRFQQLQVVGDEAAGYAAMEYRDSPAKFSELHSRFLQTIGVPVHVIHVIRNPYDIIADEVLHMEPGLGKRNAISSNSKFFDLTALRLAVDRVLAMAEAIVSMTRTLKLTVLDFHIEDLIQHPKDSMQRLCDFLAVECSQDYVRKCYSKAINSVSKTRDAVWWPRDLRRFIETRSKTFSFFRRYSFRKDI